MYTIDSTYCMVIKMRCVHIADTIAAARPVIFGLKVIEYHHDMDNSELEFSINRIMSLPMIESRLAWHMVGAVVSHVIVPASCLLTRRRLTD